MVRLIAKRQLVFSSYVNVFQFQNGAIDSIANLPLEFPNPVFQFQNGAIDSIYGSNQLNIYTVFQFQNGAIDRSPTFAKVELECIRPTNPILHQ